LNAVSKQLLSFSDQPEINVLVEACRMELRRIADAMEAQAKHSEQNARELKLIRTAAMSDLGRQS